MNKWFIAVIAFFIGDIVIATSEYIELFQVQNNTSSEIQLHIEFNQKLDFRFGRDYYELIDQTGLISPNSVKNYINKKMVTIKPNEKISLFSISRTKASEGISSVDKILQILCLLDIHDQVGNIVFNIDEIRSTNIIEVPYSAIELQQILMFQEVKYPEFKG